MCIFKKISTLTVGLHDGSRVGAFPELPIGERSLVTIKVRIPWIIRVLTILKAVDSYLTVVRRPALLNLTYVISISQSIDRNEDLRNGRRGRRHCSS